MGEESAGYLGVGGARVRDAFGHGVPQGYQQLPGHGHRRLLVANALGQALVHGLPVRVLALGDVGRLHHGMAQVAPALLGDAARSP